MSFIFFFSSRRRHTRSKRDWSSDVCSSDLCQCRGAAPGPDSLGLPATLAAIGESGLRRRGESDGEVGGGSSPIPLGLARAHAATVYGGLTDRRIPIPGREYYKQDAGGGGPAVLPRIRVADVTDDWGSAPGQSQTPPCRRRGWQSGSSRGGESLPRLSGKSFFGECAEP